MSVVLQLRRLVHARDCSTVARSLSRQRTGTLSFDLCLEFYDTETARALIESEGPWPSPAPISNRLFVPLDVDRYGDLAMVVAFGENAGLKLKGVNAATLQRRGPGDYWRRNGGGGVGYTLNDRWEIGADEKAVIKLRVHSGWGSPSPPMLSSSADLRSQWSKLSAVREHGQPTSEKGRGGLASSGRATTLPE